MKTSVKYSISGLHQCFGGKKVKIYQKCACLWILRTGEVIRENRYKGAPAPYENRGSYLIICKPDINTLSPQIYYSLFSKSDNNILFSSLLISLHSCSPSNYVFTFTNCMFPPYAIKISLELIPLAMLQQEGLRRRKESQDKVRNSLSSLPALGIQTSSHLQKPIITEIGLGWSNGQSDKVNMHEGKQRIFKTDHQAAPATRFVNQGFAA